MSENLKTIRELSDELGVSKQAIWQKIKRDASIDLRQSIDVLHLSQFATRHGSWEDER